MAGTLQPLGKQFSIVDANGNPTDYFIKWTQQRQQSIVSSATHSDVTVAINAWAAGRTLTAGNGLSGGGTLASNLTFDVGTVSSSRIVVNPDNIDLAMTAVTPGSYTNTNLTVDAYGRITAASNGASSPTPANPTATASDTAVNGTATTYMRSDAAPAVQKASSSVFGIVKVDNTTITASGGVISAVGGGGGGSHPWYWNPPLASIFSLASNSGSLTLTDDTDVGLLIDGGTPAGNIERLAYRTLTTPTGDYDLKARFNWGMPAVGNMRIGLELRDSVSGRIVEFGPTDNVAFSLNYHTAFANYNSTPFQKNMLVGGASVHWLRITKVGTTLTFYTSANGKQWSLFTSTTATAWLTNTANQVGIFVYNNFTSAGSNTMFCCDYWSLTGTAV